MTREQQRAYDRQRAETIAAWGIRCTECGEPARYTGKRPRLSAIDALPEDTVPFRLPYCERCALAVDAAQGFLVGTVVRLDR